MRTKILTLTIMMFFSVFAFAQTVERQVISSSGSNYEGANYIVSSTVGEVITGTATTSTYILTQGFQQGFFTVSKLDEEIQVNYSVYPNPVVNTLNIELFAQKSTSLNISIFDIKGVAIDKKTENINGRTIIQSDFSNLPNGTYIIRISDLTNNTVKNLQIVKQ
jgi:hypothetical protein